VQRLAKKVVDSARAISRDGVIRARIFACPCFIFSAFLSVELRVEHTATQRNTEITQRNAEDRNLRLFNLEMDCSCDARRKFTDHAAEETVSKL
jgi:hypothetical protein